MHGYRVLVLGRDFRLEWKHRTAEAAGFYVTGHLTALTPEETILDVLAMVRSSAKLAGQTNVRLDVEDVEWLPVASGSDETDGLSGLIFFPDEAASRHE